MTAEVIAQTRVTRANSWSWSRCAKA